MNTHEIMQNGLLIMQMPPIKNLILIYTYILIYLFNNTIHQLTPSYFII